MDKSCKNQFFGTNIHLVRAVAHTVYCMHLSPYRTKLPLHVNLRIFCKFIHSHHLGLFYLVGGFDANKGLSEWHRSEAAVKEKEANIGVDMEEGSHIQIVGQGG